MRMCEKLLRKDSGDQQYWHIKMCEKLLRKGSVFVPNGFGGVQNLVPQSLNV